MNITPEQAKQIHDIESYKSVTGAKRFKRTKDEKARGLDPEEALLERVKDLPGNITAFDNEGKMIVPKARKTHGGEIVIRIKPPKKLDPEYLEHLTNKEIVIEQDDKFYGWLDTKLSAPYNGDVHKLFQHILDQGLGQVISMYHFEEDFND